MITLIKGYKYNNSYDYIKTFNSKADQNNYFKSLSKITIEENNYIKERESFNIKFDYDYLVSEGVNYIIFNNGYKDIYAFIVNKEYLRKEVTRIHYEIDVIQTFLFDFTIANSFIERKMCNVNEITDFDEGLEIGEHIVSENNLVFNKESQWFAMFNGIKEQSLVFNNSGVVTSAVDLPFYTSKPLTLIDNVQYPLYFMPLRETYAAAVMQQVNKPSTSIVESARKLLGLPYVWGGNYPPLGTDSGTDCSGLCQWAYNDCKLLANVGLGGRWTTYTMIEHGTAKNINLAKAGDVVFSNFSSPGVPEHVAIISDIDINNNKLRIIEAPYEGIPIREIWINYNSNNYDIRGML